MTNREQLERLYDEWPRGDLSRAAIYDPDIECTAYGVWPEARTKQFHGLEELRAGMMIRWRGRG